MNDRKNITQSLPLRVYELEWQVSHSVYLKVLEKSFLRGKAAGDRGNIKDVVQLEENQDNRSRGMPRSSAYAGRKPAQSSSIKVHGITEGQEQSDDLGKVSETKILGTESFGAEGTLSAQGERMHRRYRGRSSVRWKRTRLESS